MLPRLPGQPGQPVQSPLPTQPEQQTQQAQLAEPTQPTQSDQQEQQVTQPTLTALHAAANTIPYPNSQQAEQEKNRNNTQQSLEQKDSATNEKNKKQDNESIQPEKQPDADSEKKPNNPTTPTEKPSEPAQPSGGSGSTQFLTQFKKPPVEQEDSEPRQKLAQANQQIKECLAAIEAATEKGNEKEVEKLQENLKSLQQQQAALHQALVGDQKPFSNASVSPPSEKSDSSVGEPSETSDSGSGVPSEISDSSVSEPSETSESEGVWSAPNINSISQMEAELRKLRESLGQWENELKNKQNEIITKTRTNTNKEEIAVCQQKIDALQKDIEILRQILRHVGIALQAAPQTPDVGGASLPQSTAQAEKSSVADMIKRTKTGRRNYAAPDNPVNANIPSSTAPTPFKQLYEGSNRNSMLLSRDNLKPFFTNEAKKVLGKMDEKIEEVAKSIDDLYEKQSAIKARLANSGEDKNQERVLKEIRKIDLEIKKRVLELGRLINRLALVEEWALPKDEQLSAKQKHEKYEQILKKYKSDETIRLEEEYKKKLADYEQKVRTSSFTNTLSLLGGAVTNFMTFFWGNSLTRLLAGSIPAAASFIGASVSGLLHAVVGGPVLKQVVAASWNAPALTEFNNYWKVAGSLWGDRLRARLGALGVDRWIDENHKKKYRDADPSQHSLIDIEQKWQQTRSLWTLFKARYKTEEAAYYSYSMNFTFKAAAAAGMSHLMASKSDGSKLIEWILHSVMGWSSGAQTVAGIQIARSQVPGAVEAVIPSREIHAAHAAMLKSLLRNLQDAYTRLRTQTPSTSGDVSERDLLKAIRRTEKSLDEAETKSRFGGTFWFEFLAQFKTVDARADAAAEAIGRALSVMPSAVLSNALASWRTSGNPYLTFASHALPALLLIAPPGWTMRPIYAGFFRALFQIVINETSPKAHTAGHVTTTTAIPDELHDSVVDGSESSSYPDSEFSESNRADESVIVTVSEGDQASDEDSDDDAWTGNPTTRNQENYWS